MNGRGWMIGGRNHRFGQVSIPQSTRKFARTYPSHSYLQGPHEISCFLLCCSFYNLTFVRGIKDSATPNATVFALFKT